MYLWSVAAFFRITHIFLDLWSLRKTILWSALFRLLSFMTIATVVIAVFRKWSVIRACHSRLSVIALNRCTHFNCAARKSDDSIFNILETISHRSNVPNDLIVLTKNRKIRQNMVKNADEKLQIYSRFLNFVFCFNFWNWYGEKMRNSKRRRQNRRT